ncbi:hypothetical protein [Tabrizicola sp. BL-A-41-H6]|uniref:hypothetical protein n=1 Tax=Tabrizicola sp. BL-A-41-H6 TaxID=3421107 RepID=UPI003D67A728
MRHDWIYDVLSDLKAYATANRLPALAAKADEALAVARAEIAAQELTPDQGGADENGPTEPTQ